MRFNSNITEVAYLFNSNKMDWSSYEAEIKPTTKKVKPAVAIKEKISYSIDFVRFPRLYNTSNLHEETKEAHTLVPDKLEFTISTILPFNENKKYTYNNVTLTSIKTKDINYKYTYSVKVDAIELGDLYTTQADHVVNRNQGYKFKTANPILYRSDLVQLHETFFNSILATVYLTRIDIAYDSNNIISRINELKEKGYGFRKKYEPTIGTDNWLKEIKHLRLGKGDKEWSIYNKTQDIKRLGKHYIEDFHTLNGLTGNVDRLELRLKKKREIENAKIDWKKISSSIYLGNIFKSFAEKDLQLIHKDQYTYSKNRNKVFTMTPLIPNLGKYITIEMDKPENAVVLNSLTNVKGTIKNCYFSFIEGGNRYDLQTLKDRVIKYHMVSWFIDRQRIWLKERVLLHGKDPLSDSQQQVINKLIQELRQIEVTTYN